MINCKVMPNGNLRITAGNETRAYIKDHLTKSYWGTMFDLFEPYFTNGGYQPFDAGEGDPFVGLTSAPCIAEAMTVEDDGKKTIDGRLWWYPSYQTRDPLEELKVRGWTEFEGAK